MYRSPRRGLRRTGSKTGEHHRQRIWAAAPEIHCIRPVNQRTAARSQYRRGGRPRPPGSDISIIVFIPGEFVTYVRIRRGFPHHFILFRAGRVISVGPYYAVTIKTCHSERSEESLLWHVPRKDLLHGDLPSSSQTETYHPETDHLSALPHPDHSDQDIGPGVDSAITVTFIISS